MGKYDDKNKNVKYLPADVFSSLMLRDIANEFAEANRLKRLELSQTLVNLNDGDLEDQA